MHRDSSPCSDSLSLRLRLLALTSATYIKSPIFMMQKVRNQHSLADSPLPACRHTISGSLKLPFTGRSFTFPSRYSFNYRSTGSIQAYGMVPQDSGRICTCPAFTWD